MTRLCLSLVSWCLVCVFWSTPASADEARATVFENVHVLTMQPEHEGRLQRDQTVVVAGDRIVAMGPQGQVEIPPGATRITGNGRVLMPGLAEMHGHVPPTQSFSGIPERYLDDVLFLYLAGGVTTVRGMLGHPHQLQLKDDIATGSRVGPTLYLAGPSFNSNTVRDRAQARQRVREHAEAGWDLLKIHPGLSLDHYRAIAAEAHEQGIDSAGHVPTDVGIRHAIILGSRTIDHLDGYLAEVDGFSERVSDEQLQELAEFTIAHGVGVVPTQALWATLIGAGDPESLLAYPELQYVPQQVRAGWRNFLSDPQSVYYTGNTAAIHQENRQRLLGALYDAGAEILLGTDAPQLFSVPGLSMRREITLMIDAGMTPYDVIYSGTVAVGRYFAEQDTFGQVRVGHRADLILVDADPIANIATVFEPAGVMAQGHWHSREAIAAKLAEIAAAYQAE